MEEIENFGTISAVNLPVFPKYFENNDENRKNHRDIESIRTEMFSENVLHSKIGAESLVVKLLTGRKKYS